MRSRHLGAAPGLTVVDHRRVTRVLPREGQHRCLAGTEPPGGDFRATDHGAPQGPLGLRQSSRGRVAMGAIDHLRPNGVRHQHFGKQTG